MRRILLALSIALLGCGDAPTLPNDTGAAGDGRLEATLESIRSQANVPALGAMLIRGDEIIETAAVGSRAFGFPEQVTANDRWHIGSITKAMTATLAAILVERGDIEWSTTVGDVFPDFVGTIRTEYVEVRLDELMYHVAGLPVAVHEVPIWPTLDTDARSLIEVRREYARELMELEPVTSRGTFLYTNAGYVVAGAMLEEVTGIVWEDLMRQEIFAPLSMASSDFGAPGQAGARTQPLGHFASGDRWTPIDPGAPDADNPRALGPAGTAHTTFTDYARYVMAHLAGARGADGLVSAATFEKLHTPASGTSYALGWSVSSRSWAGGRTLEHNGSNGRWFADVWIAPERNFAMFAVTNAGNDDATDSAILALIRRHDVAFGSN